MMFGTIQIMKFISWTIKVRLQAKNEEGDGLKKVVLEGAYKEGYKRQMDIYSWIMKRNGFNVSKDCYFVYVNGDQHFEDGMLLKILISCSSY